MHDVKGGYRVVMGMWWRILREGSVDGAMGEDK